MTGWSAVTWDGHGASGIPSVRAGTRPPATPLAVRGLGVLHEACRVQWAQCPWPDFNTGDSDHRLEMPSVLSARCLPRGGAPSVEHGPT